jgi:hypothetical protein
MSSQTTGPLGRVAAEGVCCSVAEPVAMVAPIRFVQNSKFNVIALGKPCALDLVF